MKITKREKYENVREFLRDIIKEYPYLKYHEDCDELGCDVLIKENKWFGKTVCSIHYCSASIYIEQYKNDIVDMIRRWESISGEDWRVTIP